MKKKYYDHAGGSLSLKELSNMCHYCYVIDIVKWTTSLYTISVLIFPVSLFLAQKPVTRRFDVFLDLCLE